MTNPLFVTEQLPTTSEAALREFNDRYLASIGATPPPTWSDLGDLFPTSAPLVTFPISSLALKYQKTEGEDRFKTLMEKSFDLKAEEFDVGIDGKLLDILTKVFAYRNWTQGPARMAMAEARFRNRSIVTLLEAGQSTLWGASIADPAGIDGANFFSATHLADFNDPASAEWGNYQSVAKDVTDIASLQGEVTAMQGALDESGEKIGADPDTILVPTAKYEALKNLLAKDLILQDGTGSAGVSNPYKGRFNVIHVPELTDVNDWYLVDSKLRASTGLAPWISLRFTAPNPALELRQWDESSDYFKDTGRIKVASHIWYGFALGFPHAIRKVVGA